jgi:type I restriction enzyme S subunit
MSEKRNVPKLRFSGESSEWKTNRLDEIAKIERGRFSPRPRNNPIYYGGEFPFVQTGDVVRSNGRISSYSQTINKKGLEVSKLFPAGSILITIAANIGFSGILQKDMACPDSLIGLTCKSGVDNVFLNYLLQIEQPKMDMLASAAAQKNINVEFLKPYKFNLPSLPEQQKIAEFMTAVDRRIELLQAKKEKLEAYKKGVMQRIFSQQLRFKADDGSDFPDWEERKLGEISSNFGYGLNSSATNYDGKHKYIRITDIDEETNRFVPSPLTSPDQIPNPSYQVSEGDILFARTGASVGKSYIYRKEDGELYFAGFLIRFSIRNANPYFVFLQTKRSEYQKWVKIMSMRSGQPGINAEEYKSFEFELPSLPEQQKIVAFLKSLDLTIENLNQQLTHTQTWKKGLLQKMFV